jgi:hypothetical protein
MVESTSPRTPSGAEKALIVALLLYAVAVVGPDTFRPLFHDGAKSTMRWYPIATVGFEADNNGKVISVEEDGPADRVGLRPDDQIDLGSVQPDRRAINKFVYVAHGTPIEMLVQRGANQRVHDGPVGCEDHPARCAVTSPKFLRARSEFSLSDGHLT